MNIINITNLFRAYFIENKKMLLTCSLIVFGVMAYGFTVSRMPEISPIIPFVILLWIAGTFFQSSLKRNNSTHFFNLSASSCEKLVNAIIVLLLLIIIFQILCIAGAYTGHYLLRPIITVHNEETRWIVNGTPEVWDQIIFFKEAYLAFLIALSASLFGSIYFKKSAFIKTIGAGIGSMFVIAFYYLLLILITFGEKTNQSINMNIGSSTFLQNYGYIISIAITLFFLSLTYLRLKETEV